MKETKPIALLLALSLLVLSGCGTGRAAAPAPASAPSSSAVESAQPTADPEPESGTASESEAPRTDASAPEDSASESMIPYWREDSPAMRSLVDYVHSVCDTSSEDYLPPEERIAVFDVDGTLYAERFPTYVDHLLLLHRILRDEDYAPTAELRDFAEAYEQALKNGEPEPDSPRPTSQLSAEAFAGMTVEEYRAYVRAFLRQPVPLFEHMCYSDGFYRPMVAVVAYLSEHDFTVFLSSGTERALVRELCQDALGQWIPPDRIIGTRYALQATGQGDEEGRSYNFSPEDEVRMAGTMSFKNVKGNKVFSILDEIGQYPALVFGNSSGDLSMGTCCLQHGGQVYMLLCDDTERDYGDAEEAEQFRQDCVERGFLTVSMRDEFETIYGEDVRKARSEEVLSPAA